MMVGATDILNASILIVDDQESNVSLLEQLLSEMMGEWRNRAE